MSFLKFRFSLQAELFNIEKERLKTEKRRLQVEEERLTLGKAKFDEVKKITSFLRGMHEFRGMSDCNETNDNHSYMHAPLLQL